ncbi:BTAD domain-containing putative transcriptional regulator [Nonomuraea sp. NPDC050556]|uniref:AfsR/SARP family transcriptional regulator n=1 Tax=Nonomuraea sp. NPDC050556 TaxID=3364369 RepID=UPI0037B8E54A
MGDGLRFSLLGPVRAWRDDQELDLGSPQQRLVLAVLLLAEGRTVGLDQLIDALWSEAPPRTAAHVLRTYVSRLRAVLGPDALLSVGDGYALRAGTCDVADLQRLYGEARYAEALALWQGEPLAGLAGHYADAQRARLAEQRLTALEHRLVHDLDQGKHAEVVAELNTLCAEHPTRERLRGLFMLALYRAGRQAEAIGVYTDTRQLLADQLGVDPSPELAQLYQRIITADPTLAPTPTTPPAPTGQVPRQIPADTADFTGREREVEEMATALRSGQTSALVVSAVAGAGGVGKTTLALHVAHRLAGHYPDGQLFVDLRGAGPHPLEPDTVLASFLRALGCAEAPEDPAERAALYRSTVAGRRLLVVLDNASGLSQVRPLLPGSADCGVLITSRTRLTGLSGAHQVDLDVLDPAEALHLLTRIIGETRVTAERPAAMDLVAACGFLPLAIRIAAARLAARPNWNISTLLDRLADERRRLTELRAGDLAIEATFSLGYEQLDTAHARAFRLLAVPDAADLSLAAAAALLDLPEHEAEDICEELVDVSMLESLTPGRYRFHDLLKIYARSRENDEDARRAALDRLLDSYLATMSAALRLIIPGDRRVGTAELSFADTAAVTDWAEAEELSVLSCVQQAARTPGCDLGRAIALCDAGADVLGADVLGSDSGPYGLSQIGDLLVSAAEEDKTLLARAHYLRGTGRGNNNHLDAATADGLLARDLSLEHGDLTTYARSLNLLALAALARGERPEAANWFQQAVAAWRSSGDLVGQATGLGNLARALSRLGRHGEALAAAREAEQIMRDLGGGQRHPDATYQLGIVLREAGRPQEAVVQLEASVAEYRRQKVRGWEGLALFRAGEAYLAAGQPERALTCAEEALAMLTDLGDEWGQGMALMVLGQALGDLGQPGRSRACLTEALEIFDRLSLSEADDVRALLSAVNA